MKSGKMLRKTKGVLMKNKKIKVAKIINKIAKQQIVISRTINKVKIKTKIQNQSWKKN